MEGNDGMILGEMVSRLKKRFWVLFLSLFEEIGENGQLRDTIIYIASPERQSYRAAIIAELTWIQKALGLEGSLPDALEACKKKCPQ
ncbi:MAG: hypothetical protein LBU03_04325 [Tannerellaceae bacterium]|nr:hypothetical protein [Tannerellaceae bacterium]